MLSKTQYPLVSYMGKICCPDNDCLCCEYEQAKFCYDFCKKRLLDNLKDSTMLVFDERCAVLSSVLVNIRKKRKDPVNIFGYIWLRNNHLKRVQELVLQENLNSWVRVQVCFLLYFCKCQITCQLYFSVPIKSN